jgi:hypothetical protein
MSQMMSYKGESFVVVNVGNDENMEVLRTDASALPILKASQGETHRVRKSTYGPPCSYEQLDIEAKTIPDAHERRVVS